MSKVFKILSIAWLLNLIVFTVSLFLWNYYDHIAHWSEGAWEGVYVTSIITKLALSVAIAAYGCENGVDGKKKSNK